MQGSVSGINDYQKRMLARLSVIAAEDATTVPLLPTAIFLELGATSFGKTGTTTLNAVGLLGECAATLGMTCCIFHVMLASLPPDKKGSRKQ